MKKILIISSLLSFCFTSCLKDTPNNDFSTLKPIVELFYYDAAGNPHGGIENFKSDAIIAAGQTAPIVVNFNANIASVDPLSNDLTVTLGVDDAKRIAYNSSNGANYNALPANAYTFTTKSVVVKAGTRLANFSISFDPTKIDPSMNLMLPISITDAQGQTISGNFGTIYFHMIGNPLAGVYNVTGTRYNYSGVIGYTGGAIPTPVSTATSPSPKTASPLSSTQIALDFANLGSAGYQYIITYDPTAAPPNQISVAPNSVLSGVVNYTVFIQTYDPTTKTIHIRSYYNNGVNDRIIDEVFVHQ